MWIPVAVIIMVWAGEAELVPIAKCSTFCTIVSDYKQHHSCALDSSLKLHLAT
jgi:hypothetical protein